MTQLPTLSLRLHTPHSSLFGFLAYRIAIHVRPCTCDGASGPYIYLHTINSGEGGITYVTFEEPVESAMLAHQCQCFYIACEQGLSSSALNYDLARAFETRKSESASFLPQNRTVGFITHMQFLMVFWHAMNERDKRKNIGP